MGPSEIQQKKVCFNRVPRPVHPCTGPAHGPELSIFSHCSLCTATEESFAWTRPRVNLLVTFTD